MEPTVPINDHVLHTVDFEYNRLSFIPISNLQMDQGRLIVTKDDGQRTDLVMDVDAQHSLAQLAGLPTELLAKIDNPVLVQAIWNHFLTHKREELATQKIVTRDEMVRNFAPRTMPQLAPSQIIGACQEAIGDCVFEREPVVGHRNIEFYVTGPDLFENFQTMFDQGSQFSAQDFHHFSIGVNYDFGGGNAAGGGGGPTMGGYGNRHHCGNRMSLPYDVTGRNFRIYTSTPDQVLERFTEQTRRGVEYIRSKVIPSIRSTMDTRMQEPHQDLLDLAHEHGMPEVVQELLFEAYRVEDLGGTKYHVINALTRAANSDRCPQKWKDKLRALAGESVIKHDPATPDRRCTACHQKVELPKPSKSKK